MVFVGGLFEASFFVGEAIKSEEVLNWINRNEEAATVAAVLC